MIQIHLVEAKDPAVLKRVVEGNYTLTIYIIATQYCFEQKNIYKQEVLAVVVQQLVDFTPIPALTMRTVSIFSFFFFSNLKIMQTASRFPKLNSFIATMLSRLITKQVWNEKRLWEGFVKCCKVCFVCFFYFKLFSCNNLNFSLYFCSYQRNDLMVQFK